MDSPRSSLETNAISQQQGWFPPSPRSSSSGELRVLFLTLEYAEPWIFSGNGVYSRSFVHNLTRAGSTRVLVVCGRPAGQITRPRPVSANSKLISPSKSNTAATKTSTPSPSNPDTIREGGRIEVKTVSLPVWFKLDRNSSWKEYGEGVVRFAKEVGSFHPDIVLGVDWTSRLAFESLRRTPTTKLQNVPFVYLCFRVFSSTPGLNHEDRTFYAQREAETIQAAVRTVALSRCDAVALDALRTMTLPRGATESLRATSLIQVITPPLRDDVRNASLKLTRLPQPALQSQNSSKKWSWAHSSSHGSATVFTTGPSSSSHLNAGSAPTPSSSSSSSEPRVFITCCCRISPEKEVMRFVELCENISSFLKENELIPYLVGPAADEEYARRVYQRLKRAFPGDSSIVVSDFVPADRLQSIFAKTVLNIHPARNEPFGMTITEAAAFGVPTLLDGSGLVGATDVLPFTDNRSIACNMKRIKQASITCKTLLRKDGRSFLELIGKRAQDAVLSWGSSEWALHVRRELLDDVLKNAFRAYDGSGFSNSEGGMVNAKGQARSSNKQVLEAMDERGVEDHSQDDTWPWLPMAEWTALQISMSMDEGEVFNGADSAAGGGGDDSGGGQVFNFDLDGVRLVVEQLVKLSAYSLASLLMQVKQQKKPVAVEMTVEMYEWAWYLLAHHNACLGPARFRLVPSRLSEDMFWGLFFAVVRDGVVRLVTAPIQRTASGGLVSHNNTTAEEASSLPSSPSPTKQIPPASMKGLDPLLPSFVSHFDIKTQAIERLVQRDECARGIAPIADFIGKGVVGDSARAIFHARRVLILTGFPCLVNCRSPQETDGPPGAVALAKACSALGKRVFFVIEEPNADVLRAAILQCFPKTKTMLLRSHGCTKVEIFGTKGQVSLEIFPPKSRFTEAHYARLEEIIADLKSEPSHMVAIERAGPAKDGLCRTMRGRVLGDDLLAPLHILFEKAQSKDGSGVTIGTTGIGDGGNEVGMGNAYEVVRVKMGPEIACAVGCDHLLACSVSNWGGHAICAALVLVALTSDAQLFNGPGRKTKALESLVGTDALLQQVVQSCVDAGSGDGITGNADTLSVDGLPFSKTIEVIQALRGVVESFDENLDA